MKNLNLETGKDRVFATKKQAAAAMGFAVQQIKRDQDAGCPAIKQNGSVSESEYLAWRQAHPELKIDTGGLESIESARRRRETAKANAEELRVLELKGDVIRLDDVKRTVTRAIVTFKAKMLAIPRRLSQKLAITTDPVTVEESLASEINEALEELHKGEWTK